tara:strand:- start:5507 stop:6757 length:1251 start_codon:yes stop_codon:yes gene_type:complete
MTEKQPPEKLTERRCQAAAPGPSPYFVWDGELKGFGLRVMPSGAKSFVVQYRAGYGRRGQTRRMTIGRYADPSWPLQVARNRAKQILKQVAYGEDPLAEARESSASMTVAELCELYLEEGCTTKKPRTVEYDRGRISGHIIPLLGKTRAAEVKRADIERLMRDIAAGKTAKDVRGRLRGVSQFRGGPGAATRTVGLLQGIFTFAEARGIVEGNPTRGVRRFADKRMERFLSGAELASLGNALADLEREGISPNGLNVIRLLSLTGARRGEIESLRWSEVDLERGLIRLTDSKTGAKAFPVAPAAVNLLQSLAKQRHSEWAFPASRGEGHFTGTGKIWAQVRARAKLENVRLHDLRHTFASFGASSGYGLPVIGAILGHSQASTTARYAHLANDPVSQAATRIGDEIEGWLKSGTYK